MSELSIHAPSGKKPFNSAVSERPTTTELLDQAMAEEKALLERGAQRMAKFAKDSDYKGPKCLKTAAYVCAMIG